MILLLQYWSYHHDCHCLLLCRTVAVSLIDILCPFNLTLTVCWCGCFFCFGQWWNMFYIPNHDAETSINLWDLTSPWRIITTTNDATTIPLYPTSLYPCYVILRCIHSFVIIGVAEIVDDVILLNFTTWLLLLMPCHTTLLSFHDTLSLPCLIMTLCPLALS